MNKLNKFLLIVTLLLVVIYSSILINGTLG